MPLGWFYLEVKVMAQTKFKISWQTCYLASFQCENTGDGLKTQGIIF